METFLLVMHLLFAIFLVVIILMQQASGGALDGLGGGSNSASGLFNARGKGNLLTKITTILATLFIVSSITLSLYYKNTNRGPKSILEVSVEQIEDIVSAPISKE